MEACEYDLISDEELISRLREGSEDIAEYLCSKYKYLVKAKAGSMYILGAENEDLIQEGMIGLFKAIRDYDPDREASFRTFANICISRQMYKLVEASQTQKSKPLNDYISINGDDTKEGENSEFLDSLISDTDSNPENIIIDRENVSILRDKFEKMLSPFEVQVFRLRLTGMNYAEIAEVLGRDAKSTDNALNRIKTKLKMG